MALLSGGALDAYPRLLSGDASSVNANLNRQLKVKTIVAPSGAERGALLWLGHPLGVHADHRALLSGGALRVPSVTER